MVKNNTKIFDYESLSQKYSISPEILDEVVNEARSEFDEDEMMVELHVIRSLRHIASKRKQGVLS